MERRTTRVRLPGFIQEDDEIGKTVAIGVEVPGCDERVLVSADDEHTCPGSDRRQRGTAAVEDDEVWAEARRERRSVVHVRDRDRAGQAATRAAASDRRHTSDGSRLEVIRGGMTPASREGEQVVD